MSEEAGPQPSPGTDPAEVPVAYRAVRGGIWVLVGSYWNIGWGFLANILLVRMLDSEAYGAFALAMFFAQILRVQPKLGLGYAFVHERETSGELLGSYVPAEAALAVSGLALSLLAIPVLLALGYAPLVVQVSVVLALAFVAEGLAGIGFTLCDKELLFGQTSLVQSVAATLSYLPAFWLAANGAGVWSLVSQTVLYNVLMLASIAVVVARRLPHLRRMKWLFSLRRVRELVAYGLKVGMANLSGALLTQLDSLMIGTIAGTSALGYYDRAYRTAQWPGTLMSSLLARVGFNTYARLQADPPRLAKTVTMVTWAIAMLAFPLALALFVSAPDLVSWLYTDSWLPSVPFLQILVLYSIAQPLAGNAGTFFIATGRPGIITRYNTMQVVALGVAGLVMTILWSATGTAIAVAAVFAVGTALAYRRMVGELNVDVAGLLGVPALASIAVLAGFWAFGGAVPLAELSAPLRVLVKAGAAAGSFFVLAGLAQPRLTLDRISYVWRLVRQTGAS